MKTSFHCNKTPIETTYISCLNFGSHKVHNCVPYENQNWAESKLIIASLGLYFNLHGQTILKPYSE